MEPAAAKQQIVERLKQANNVLVTVRNNPNVDELAACIGLTLLLNRLDKHATAVFSGQVPSTIEFLQPEKTIEQTTDSLRDFIISLDKSKADKLRYKVEDDVVRIFITPYRTKISEQDLVFSEGDFNVEVVMALGVEDRAQIDQAITAHGRILHDATVITVNPGQGSPPKFGHINWLEPTASSLCEMLVSISEAFGTGLIDAQMATAFLTGIVAETERFSNAKTTPKVMTMSAQLMAAGANQQLIAAKLEEPVVPKGPLKAALDKAAGADELKIQHPKKAPPPAPKPTFKPASDIEIDDKGNLKPPAVAEPPPAPSSFAKAAEDKPKPKPQPVPLPPPPPPLPPPPPPPPPSSFAKATEDKPMPSASPPSASMSGHTYLDPTKYQPTMSTPFSAATDPGWSKPPETDVDPLATDMHAPTPDVSHARSAVNTAIQTQPFDPAGHPLQAFGADNLSPELHTPVPSPSPPPPGNGTPSLELPMNGQPPPGPPPLMPASGSPPK